jgi:hypothetical protein
MRMFKRGCVLLLVILATACSGSDSPTAPSIAQVGGVWDVTLTLTAVTGGDCLAAALQSIVGTVDRGTMQVSQTGSSLTATFTSSSDGGSTSFQGTAGASSIALNETGCSACNLIGVTCPNGTRRDFKLQTGGINATVSGNRATGTGAESYNIFVAGTSTTVGSMVINSNFSATKG